MEDKRLDMYCLYGISLVNPEECYAPAFENGQKITLINYPSYGGPVVVTVNNDCEGVFRHKGKEEIKKVSEAFPDCEDTIIVDHNVSGAVCCEMYGPSAVAAIPVDEGEEEIHAKSTFKKDLSTYRRAIAGVHAALSCIGDARDILERDGGVPHLRSSVWKELNELHNQMVKALDAIKLSMGDLVSYVGEDEWPME